MRCIAVFPEQRAHNGMAQPRAGRRCKAYAVRYGLCSQHLALFQHGRFDPDMPEKYRYRVLSTEARVVMQVSEDAGG